MGRFRDTLRDAGDILRHARGVREIARAIGPAALRRPRVLNTGGGASAPAASVVARLNALRRQLEGDVLDAGGRVAYARLHDRATFAALEAASAELAGAGLDELARDADRIALWVNVYNILTVHGVIALGIERSVMEVPSFFARVAYQVGGHVLTLDDIENGILRRNAPHPVSGRRLFAAGDPRAALAPSAVDPRIHAALVCAALSCPPIAMYDPDRLDAQLALASRSFVSAGVEVDDAARELRIPLVFRWYAIDFGGEAGVRAFLEAHADVDLARTRDYRLVHMRYDWSLNAAT